jgi:tetratricopeptide (TPR) repeat protein
MKKTRMNSKKTIRPGEAMMNMIGKTSSAAAILLFMALLIVVASTSTTAYSKEMRLHGLPATRDAVQDRELERAASRLYDGALKYYKAEAYWKAARELITILDYYPAYSKIDGVLMHLGESLYSMRMYDSASRMFRYVATKYPNSAHLGESLHGLQRIFYEAGDYVESLKIYNNLVDRAAGNPVIDGAHYYGGMAYFQLQSYDSTIVMLAKISPRSSYFDYGLYTAGLALLKKKALLNRSRSFASC